MKYMSSRTVQCLVVLGMAGLCLPALAQNEDKVETGEPVPAVEQGAARSPIQVSVGGSYQAQTDVDRGGDFSLSRFRTGLAVPLRFNDQFALATSLKYELASYDFGGRISAWHNINTLSGVALLKYKIDEHWLVYGGPAFRFSAESGAGWDNAKQGGGLIAVNYIMNDKLSFGGGLFGMSQIENSFQVLPILTANWMFADNWKLNLGFTDVATAGYGLGVSWDCCKDWQLTFGGQMNKARFRIDGNGATSDGVGQDQSVTLTVAATWSPNKTISGTAFVGIAAGGELRLENSTGRKLYSQNYDPAPILGLKADVRF
jgi:hypothetical protein